MRLRPGEAFWLTTCVTDPLTEGGRTAVLVFWVIDHYPVYAQGLRYLEATAVQGVLASIPVTILAVYLLPSKPLNEPDISASLGNGLPNLIEGDPNAKHVDWNSRLIMTWGRLICDYTNKNSCLIYRPTTISHNSFATADVLDITLKKTPSYPSVSDYMQPH
jgi:hypothetical protein